MENHKIIILILLLIVILTLLYRLYYNSISSSISISSSSFVEKFSNDTDSNKNDNKDNNNDIDNTDKIAFLFLTRNNLKRPEIWEEFLKGKEDKYSIYCHAKEPKNVTDKLLKDTIIPEYIDTCWGCINLVEANILLMKNALLNPLNKKFILVSESCVPIVSFDVLYKSIINNNKSRIGIQKINSSPERYNQISNPEFPKKDFIKHSGSGNIFNRVHVKMLVNSLPKLDNWKKQMAPDEHYKGNTLRVMDKDFNNNNENIKTTFDIWQKDDLDLPNLNDNIILKSDEYILLNKVTNKAIDSMRDKGFLFIRKVDENTEFDKEYILDS